MTAPLLHRLAGLETEYAVRFRPDDASTKRPLSFHLLEKLIDELRRRLPVVTADYPKIGFFIATGGAVWLERPSEGLDHPLIEGSTPECRGPRQLLAAQRAQDRLFSAAARDVAGGEFTLSKSDCDAAGNFYGAQENYELTLATGWRLAAWRIALVVLLTPLMALTWIALMPLVMGILVYYALAGFAYLCYLELAPLFRLFMTVPDSPTVRQRLFGVWGGEPFRFMPRWVSLTFTFFEKILFIPTIVAFTVVMNCTAFHRARRDLVPFLISRAVISGSGRLLPDGSFHIASKAAGIRMIGGVGLFGLRPIFAYGPQLKALTFFSLAPNCKFPSLLSSRQRLQIGLGDGNLCDESEYLRIGTTMLIIDAIEAGHPIPVPHLRSPVQALRAIIADPSLTTRVPTRDGRLLTALEIQRIYLEACRDFVAVHPNPPREAYEILQRWSAVLDDLETRPDRLIGRLDWVTKLWLLKTCATAPWEARKKIDLRYHELSPDGYFERLRSTGIVESILTESEIEAAENNPPPDSPATQRGQDIRRFSASGLLVKANWQSVNIGAPPTVTRLPCDPADRSRTDALDKLRPLKEWAH